MHMHDILLASLTITHSSQCDTVKEEDAQTSSIPAQKPEGSKQEREKWRKKQQKKAKKAKNAATASNDAAGQAEPEIDPDIPPPVDMSPDDPMRKSIETLFRFSVSKGFISAEKANQMREGMFVSA